MKKYEIAIYKEESKWEAFLACLCGQMGGERMKLEDENFDALLDKIREVLAKHEAHGEK